MVSDCKSLKKKKGIEGKRKEKERGKGKKVGENEEITGGKGRNRIRKERTSNYVFV